jgi:hypothetical protein
MGLSLPVRVQGFNPDGTSWEEISTTDDVSQGGVSFPLKRPLDLGQVLLLALPLPKRLRQYDLVDSSYRVYALVRGMIHRPENSRIGVMFFGKFPPRGFHENPGARYLLPTDTAASLKSPPSISRTSPLTAAGGGVPPTTPRDAAPPLAPPPTAVSKPTPTTEWAFAVPTPPPGTSKTVSSRGPAPEAGSSERRKHPRVELFVNFLLQQVDEFGVVLQEELTVADNLGKGGAHLITTLDFNKSDVVLLQEAGGGFATRAEVRDLVKGKDGNWRLHLKFMDRQAPERLLR